jgi:ATP-dependent Clp protease ATP-binding subunit ClpA
VIPGLPLQIFQMDPSQWIPNFCRSALISLASGSQDFLFWEGLMRGIWGVKLLIVRGFFWVSVLFSFAVHGYAEHPDSSGGMPQKILGSFVFADSQVAVRFIQVPQSQDVQIIVGSPLSSSTEVLYTGPIKRIGVNGHQRGLIRGIVEPIHHRSNSYTYAITDKNESLLISNRGTLLRHPLFPTEVEALRVRHLEETGNQLFLLSVISPNMLGTYFYEAASQMLIKVASVPFKDEQMNEVALDMSHMMLYVPGGRDLDLLRLELEAVFEPKATKAVLTTSGSRIDALAFLQDLLPDLRDGFDRKKMLPPTDKDKEVIQRIVEALKRKESKSVVLLGQSGTGKTTIIEGLIDKLPETWEVMQVPREALEQGAGLVGEIDKRVNALIQASRSTPLVLVFDEFHSLKGLGTHSNSSVDLMQMLKKHIAAGDLMIVATDTPEEYQRAFGSDPALRRRFTEIRIEEPRDEELLRKLHSWIDLKFGFKLDESMLNRVISVSSDFDPGSHEPARSVRLLEQIKTDLIRAKKTEVKPEDIDKAAWNMYGVGPQNPTAFVQANEEGRQKLLEVVIDQPQLVSAMMDLWREVNLGVGSKKHRSLLAVGPTGAGKTFSGQAFAKHVLRDPERFLEIDATKYRNGVFDSLIGTARYSAESPQGILPEFLRGRGKGRNVILINEIEKAHPDLIKILMEMLDTGKLQGGDGQTYYLGRSLVVFTSNRGADEIYPVGQGAALKRDELMRRLATFTDKRVRDLFLKPSSKNLYDTSQVWGAAELQRIDRAVAVVPPSFEGAVAVVRGLAQSISEQIKKQYFYSLTIDEATIEEIVRTYYVPEEGVRSLLQQTMDLFNRLHQEAVLQLSPAENHEMVATWDHRSEKGEASILLANKTNQKVTLVDHLLIRLTELNPLQDRQSISRLQGLEDELGKSVFGQAEAIKVVSRAVRTRALNSKLVVPAHALLLGSTGIGKTEIGRSLAQVLYGTSQRMRQFGLGQVKTEHDWSNIFGSPRGIVGSETMSPFEKALHDFPEGMVIILDEIGNMGADPRQPSMATPRSELLKRLYDMFEEGTWTSPLGNKYDLRKHFILMTSNEGQELFENLPNDDLRLSEWKRVNRRDYLQDLLRHSGWPEPLLGRIGNNIALMKPLIHAEQMQVAKKEIERVLGQLKAAYEFDNIKVADGFYERLTESFFSHSRGGRSLREVAENAVVDLVGQALIEHAMDRESFQRATLTLDVEDNFAGRIRRNSKDLTAREVTLKLHVKIPKRKVQEYSMDITREAKPKRLADLNDSLIVAYHEAGHAVANQPELTGAVVGFITIRGEGGYGGYVRYESDDPVYYYSREAVIARIAGILAGNMAQQLAGFSKDSGWSSDLRQARRLAEEAVTTWGLSDEALKFPVKDGVVIATSEPVQREIASLVEAGKVEAERILRARWALVRMTAIRLLIDGHLSREDFESLQKQESKKKEEMLQMIQESKNPHVLSKRWKCADFLRQAAAGH